MEIPSYSWRKLFFHVKFHPVSWNHFSKTTIHETSGTRNPKSPMMHKNCSDGTKKAPVMYKKRSGDAQKMHRKTGKGGAVRRCSV